MIQLPKYIVKNSRRLEISLDNRNNVGTRAVVLSKAFDSLHHGLL